MPADTESAEGAAPTGDASVLVRLLAALLVKDDPKPTAATRLLGLGLSVSDVAKVLEIKPSSVRVIRHRAKSKPMERKSGATDAETSAA